MQVEHTKRLPLSALRVGERLLVRCDDGAFTSEYALFSAGDVILSASDRISVRETGYMTTASQALGRLAELGATPSAATQAARSLSREAVQTYAHDGVRASTFAVLGAYELFESHVFHETLQSYDGVWLDLASLGRAIGVKNAAAALQLLYLAAALSEVAGETRVLLATSNLMSQRRANERSHRRVARIPTVEVIAALAAVRPRSTAGGPSPLSTELLHVRLRERASAVAEPRHAHVVALERSLGDRATPAQSNDEMELAAIEHQIRTGDPRGLDERLDSLQRTRGPLPWIRYLRAWAALMRGDTSPLLVAQELSDISDSIDDHHQTDVLAARAWLASGEVAHARYFARRALEDASAPESVQAAALELLEATEKTARSHLPPPVDASPMPRIPAASRAMTSPDVAETPSPPVSAPGVSMPPFATEPPPRVTVSQGAPPFDFPQLEPVRVHAELVETLALPPDADDAMLAYGAMPTTPIEARIASTRLSRDLARDYRLWYGSTLRIDAIAIETMQRHLRSRFADARLDDPRVLWELQRHGALVSEILARALGATWVDLSPTEPGHWAMHVPPSTRTWPIGRVYRFVALGQREKDLVDYYIDLEGRARNHGRD